MRAMLIGLVLAVGVLTAESAWAQPGEGCYSTCQTVTPGTTCLDDQQHGCVMRVCNDCQNDDHCWPMGRCELQPDGHSFCIGTDCSLVKIDAGLPKGDATVVSGGGGNPRDREEFSEEGCKCTGTTAETKTGSLFVSGGLASLWLVRTDRRRRRSRRPDLEAD